MKLHPYQLSAIDHLLSHDRAGLFMEMGLGKTATVLRAIGRQHLPVLAIAPKRVAEMVWSEENSIWSPGLSLAVAAGTPEVRKSILARTEFDITVIGRDNIADVPVGKFKTIVLDELSSFKSHTSNRFKIAKKLTKDATYVWGLTGTPSPNGYMDLWSELFLLDRGDRLGTGVGAYRDRYFVEKRVGESRYAVTYDLRPGARERIDNLLSDICLSFLAEDYLDLEEPVYNEVVVPNVVRGIYSEMKNNLVADLRLIGTDALHTAANAAVLSNRLSQITAGFLYSDNLGGAATRLHAEKTKAVQEIVEGTGSPVIVFYRFLEEVEALRKALPQARTIDEVPYLQSSWNAGEVPVLLAHPASIGHGLNLQKGPGHTMIFTSPPWSLEEYQQSVGRLARQGQAHRVTVHHIVVGGTIDSVILDALQAKESVQTALLRYLA